MYKSEMNIFDEFNSISIKVNDLGFNSYYFLTSKISLELLFSFDEYSLNNKTVIGSYSINDGEWNEFRLEGPVSYYKLFYSDYYNHNLTINLNIYTIKDVTFQIYSASLNRDISETGNYSFNFLSNSVTISCYSSVNMGRVDGKFQLTSYGFTENSMTSEPHFVDEIWILLIPLSIILFLFAIIFIMITVGYIYKNRK
jgi:hypothetical protein